MKTLTAVALALTAAFALARPVTAADNAPPVVRVGEWQVTAAEVDAALAAPIYEMRQQLHQQRMRKARELLADHLLKSEAAARKLSVEEMLTKEVDTKAKKFSPEEVEAFVQANRERLPKDGQNLNGQIQKFLDQQALNQARNQFISSLLGKYPVEINLPPPTPPRMPVPGPQDLSKGPADAPVTIVEFSDFQCPYCRRAKQVVDQVVAAYPKDVRLIFRHFPLPSHAKAPKASEASQCAADQGQFWAYHDALFTEGQGLEIDALKALAGTLKLDSTTFDHCLDSGKHTNRVRDDRRTGDNLGVTGTPTFFINGLLTVGVRPLDQFKKLIDSELALSKTKAKH